MSKLDEISEFLQKGRSKVVKELVQSAIEEGFSPKEILEEGLLHGMSIIGEKFKNNEVFVPEVLIAARAMNNGVEVLKPHLAAAGVKSAGTVIIGTVKGDMHDIGKNLVKMMIESKGLDVIDLGVDAPAQKFVDAVIEYNAKVVCCSALLTTTMPEMKAVVEAFENSNMRDKVKIMVGGAPINEAFAKSIGADRYTPDAASAAVAALNFFTA